MAFHSNATYLLVDSLESISNLPDKVWGAGNILGALEGVRDRYGEDSEHWSPTSYKKLIDFLKSVVDDGDVDVDTRCDAAYLLLRFQKP